MIQRAIAGYPRRPAAEPVRITAEARQVAGYLQPGLGGDIFGVRFPDQGPDIAQQSRVHSAVHSPEGVLTTVLCREHRSGQLRVVPQHFLNPSRCPARPIRSALHALHCRALYASGYATA